MPIDGKARAQDFQLLGTWVYGTKRTKYHITQNADGHLHFEGPHTGAGTVSGVLQPNGDWFQTELRTSTGECVGKIRLRFVKEFGIACSNFKSAKVANSNWGKDIFANREELALADDTAGGGNDKDAQKKQGQQQQKKKRWKVEVDPEEPLLLVGECNNWNMSEAKRKFAFTMLPEWVFEGRVHHVRVEVGLEDFSFQIVSAKKGWDWRLYPPLQTKSDLSKDPGDCTARPVGEDGDKICQGRNFHLRGLKGWSVEIAVWMKDFQNFAICYTDPYDRTRKEWGDSSEHMMSFLQEGDWDRPAPFPKEPVVDHRNPAQYSFEEIEPLQLVGECCKWNAETPGLELIPQRHDADERSHRLTFRMQARKVDFQIISRKAGFSWRLFPNQTGGQRLHSGRSRRIQSSLGGESDGHNKNFILEETFLSTVQLVVDLQQANNKLGNVYVWYAVVDSATPQVGIAPKWTQYPPSKLSILDEEFLQAAKTKEEQEDVLERRRALISKLRWTMAEEYADQNVQAEVLELRKHYPYHGRKSSLALEFDEELGRQQALGDSPAGPTVDSATAEPQAASLPGEPGPVHSNAPPEPVSGDGLLPPVDVTVHVSREFDVKVYLQVPHGTRIAELRAMVAQQDPTGGTQIEDVWLCNAWTGSGPLADDVQLTQEMAELECCEQGAEDADPQATAAGALGAEGGVPSAPPDPLEAMLQDLELKLSVTQQKLQKLEQKPMEDTAAAGVTSALKEQLMKQAKAFEVALDEARECKSAEAAEEKIRKKWAGAQYEDSVFGPADVQWSHALQELPAVRAAQLRALKAHHLPVHAETVRKAAAAVMQHDSSDAGAAVATALVLKRLRFFASPHPQMMHSAAEALRRDRAFVGTPQEWFHGLDLLNHADWTLVRPDLEKLWKNGAFKQRFGGPKSGLFRVYSDEDLHAANCKALLSAAVTLKDQLKCLIKAMGTVGENLEVEPRVMVSFHSQGEVLPGRVDSVGTARRLSLCLHYSMGHFRTLDGGALKLSNLQGNAKDMSVPAAGGYFCGFYTQEFAQAIDMVKLSCGRWSLTACAQDIQVAEKMREDGSSANQKVNTKQNGEPIVAVVDDNYARMNEVCAVCEFSGGDGVTMNCESKHRICRECLQKEIRMEIQATCPACVAHADQDRVYVADQWDLFESTSIEDIGCICPRTGDFNVSIDPGSRVVISGCGRESGLNGKLGEAIWWDMQGQCWDVHVFALDRVVKLGLTSLNIADCCPAGGGLSRCPCWPAGRGVYPVSLGCRCCVKQGILECGDAGGGVPAGWPYFHGMVHMPFDWNLTSLEGVLFFLRHNFAHYFYYSDMRVVKAVNREDVKFDNYHSSMHAFIHHVPAKDGSRLSHRADRFKVLCRHSRDVRAARTLLFIRYMHQSSELSRIDELYGLLRLWAGSQIRLCIVIMKQTEKGKERLYRHARFPRVLIYLVGFIQVMEFQPFREVCRFGVYDEAGMLNCPLVKPEELSLIPFRDPYTTKSDLCPEGDWLTDLKGKDPTFYPDCPAAQMQAQRKTPLEEAVALGDLKYVRSCLQSPAMRSTTNADPNGWNALGRRPLHHAVEAEKGSRRVPTPTAVRIVAELLLNHADPHCHDNKRVTTVEHARRSGASREVCALVRAAALEELVDRASLFNALEMLDRLSFNRLARVLDVGALRAMGEAELAWRHPPPDSESYIAELEDVIVGLERLPEGQRKKEMKRLLLEWHPDKNGHRLDLATTVFQFLNAQKDRVVKR